MKTKLLVLLYLLIKPVSDQKREFFDKNADIETLVKKEYPSAVLYQNFIKEFSKELKDKYKIDVSNLTPACCSCSDEINRTTDNMHILGNEFIMGGLAGLPYVGKTGIKAFAHHIKEQGIALIFYAPHIGMTDYGELGKVLRKNQSHYSSTCGALSLALERFKSNISYHHTDNDDDDFQQMHLEHVLEKHKDTFLRSKNPIKEITDITYNIIEQEILRLIHTCKKDFKLKKVILVGGVIINTSPYFNDYIDIRKKEVISLKNNKSIFSFRHN